MVVGRKLIKEVFTPYLASYQGLSRKVWLLALLMLINRSGAMVIPFLSVYLTQKLAFTLQQTGWVMGFFGLGSLAGVYIGGILTDRFGYYRVQLGSLMLSGMMFFILQTIQSFLLFNVLIFFTSVLTDAFRPANLTAVAEYSKPEDQTRSISLIRLAINAGWAVGPALGGVIALRLGYQWLFWLDGITWMLAGILLWVLFKPGTPRKATITEEETQIVSTGIWKDHRFLVFLGLNTLTMIVFFQLLTSIPVYFKANLGLDEDRIGLIMAINGLVIALIEMPIVHILEKRVSSLRVITIGTLFIALSVLVFNFGSWTGLAVMCILLLTFGEIFHMPFANAYTMGRANRANMGKYMSYYGMSFSLAFILAPVLGMQVAEHFGYLVLWNALAIVGFIATLSYYWLYRRSRTP